MSARIKTWALCLASLVVLACAAAWWRTGARGTRSIELPDGTVLTLRWVAYGTNNVYREGTAWDRFVGRLPSWLTTHLKGGPRNSSTFISATPDLHLVLHKSAASTKRVPQDVFFTVCDENGVEYLPRSEGHSVLLGSTTGIGGGLLGERLQIVYCPSFPRRASRLLLRAYSWSQTNNSYTLVCAGEFRIPNPARGPWPVWAPEPLPATRRAGDLEVTLTRLEAVVDPAETFRIGKTNLKSGLAAAFQITRNGEPAAAWKLESLRLQDATGNSLRLWSGDKQTEVRDQQFRSPWRLGLGEPAWKLRVELSHVAEFAPDDLCELKGVPVKPGAAPTNTDMSVQLGGARVHFRKLASEPNWGGNASIALEVMPKPQDFRVELLRVTDERGRNIVLVKPPAGYGDFQYSPHFFGIDLPPDSKTLNLTLARKESRFVEFTVKAQTNGIPGGR